jgi:hypothetical protein
VPGPPPAGPRPLACPAAHPPADRSPRGIARGVSRPWRRACAATPHGTAWPDVSRVGTAGGLAYGRPGESPLVWRWEGDGESAHQELKLEPDAYKTPTGTVVDGQQGHCWHVLPGPDDRGQDQRREVTAMSVDQARAPLAPNREDKHRGGLAPQSTKLVITQICAVDGSGGPLQPASAKCSFPATAFASLAARRSGD